MKKFIVALGLVVGMVSNLSAQVIKVNNECLNLDAKIIDGRTFVKLRQVSEILNCEVQYNEAEKVVTVTKEEVSETIRNMELRYKIGDTIYEYDCEKAKAKGKNFSKKGGGRTMDVSPQIINDSTYLPIRYVADPLEFDVLMGENKEIILEKRV